MEAENNIPVFLVDAYSDPVHIKVNGKANYLTCAPMNSFFKTLIEDDNKSNFVIDFTDCTGMDSTFLGLITGAAIKAKGLDSESSFSLCNVTERNLELIENLGLGNIMSVNAPMPEPKSPAKLEKSESGAADASLILEAHQSLIHLSAHNYAKFQDVISFLKKHSQEQQQNNS